MCKSILSLVFILGLLLGCASNITPAPETVRSGLEQGMERDPKLPRNLKPIPPSIGESLECVISKNGYNRRVISVPTLSLAQVESQATASTLNYEGHAISIASQPSASASETKTIDMQIDGAHYKNLNLLRNGLNVMGAGDGVELQCYPNDTIALTLPLTTKFRCRAEKAGWASVDVPIVSTPMNSADRISSGVNFGGHRITALHLLPVQSEGQNLFWLSLDSKYSKSYDYRGGGLSLEDRDGTTVFCDNTWP